MSDVSITDLIAVARNWSPQLGSVGTRRLFELLADALESVTAPTEPEWATELRVDGSVEHRFPANSEADARATAAERGEIAVRRNIGPWVEVTS